MCYRNGVYVTLKKEFSPYLTIFIDSFRLLEIMKLVAENNQITYTLYEIRIEHTFDRRPLPKVAVFLPHNTRLA